MRSSVAPTVLLASAVLLALVPIGCSSSADDETPSVAAGSAGGGSPGNTPVETSGGSGSVTIDPGANADAGASSGEQCGEDEYQAESRPVALFILLDQSGSMTEYGDRWTPVTTALKTFVSDPGSSSLRAGLQYFPYLVEDDDIKCEVDRYSDPAVAIDELSTNAETIAASIDDHYFTHEQYEDEERSGTPTRPAVQGSAAYLKSWLEEHPDHAGVLVLATDGSPTGVCDDNGVDDVAGAIADAAGGELPVKTYVIGIGVEENLEAMAEAGETDTPPFIVDGSGENTGAEFLAALQTIRGAALPCDYALPEPTSGSLDPELVNVRFAASGAQSASFYRVADLEACTGKADEWYYDDPAAPERIVLCPEACMHVSSDGAASVKVLLGCATLVR